MHKSTSILDFLKRGSRPPSGGSFTAYGILLLVILIWYANTNRNRNRNREVADCELEYNGTRGGGSYSA